MRGLFLHRAPSEFIRENLGEGSPNPFDLDRAGPQTGFVQVAGERRRIENRQYDRNDRQRGRHRGQEPDGS